MRNKSIFFLIFFILITGCICTSSAISFSTGRNEGGKFSGDTIKVDYQDVEIKCLIGSGGCNKCVINNEKEYKALIEPLSPHSDCIDYKLPSIDFIKYTLIGQVITVGGCKRPDSFKELVKIPSEKKYILKVKVQKYGICKTGLKIKIWIIIPKIESDYTVEYNTTYYLNQEK